MTDSSFDGAGSGHSRARQINLALSVAHPSAKVSIGGGQSFFPTGQNAHMASQTGTTGGGTDHCARREKCLDEALFQGLAIDLLGCRNDDEAKGGSHFSPL